MSRRSVAPSSVLCTALALGPGRGDTDSYGRGPSTAPGPVIRDRCAGCGTVHRARCLSLGPTPLDRRRCEMGHDGRNRSDTISHRLRGPYLAGLPARGREDEQPGHATARATSDHRPTAPPPRCCCCGNPGRRIATRRRRTWTMPRHQRWTRTNDSGPVIRGGSVSTISATTGIRTEVQEVAASEARIVAATSCCSDAPQLAITTSKTNPSTRRTVPDVGRDSSRVFPTVRTPSGA